METSTIKTLISERFSAKQDSIIGPANNPKSFSAPADFNRFFLDEVPDNDLDAGDYVKDIFGNLLTYIPTSSSRGDWYVWNGSVHELDPVGTLDDRLAAAMADHLRDLAIFIKQEISTASLSKDAEKYVSDLHRALAVYAKGCRSTAGLSSLVSRIRSAFTRERDYFDKDQQWAVMSDGKVLDLRSVSNVPLDPDPSRPVLRQLGVTLDPDNLQHATPKWDAALDAWLPNKEEQRYLQIAAGAAMLGRGDAKNIVTLVGVSNTGKSTYLNVMRRVFGSYAGALPATAIVQKYGGSTNFEQHKARGKRLLHLSEPQNQRTDDAFLKSLTGGGEPIPTASKGKDTVEWMPQCVLHIAANHVPKIDTQDDAIVGRLNIVSFDHVFTPGSAGFNRNLEAELFDEEGAGILLWILIGAEEYDRLGVIPVPASIKARAQSNIVEGSAPLRWLTDLVESGHYRIDAGANGSEMMQPKDGYELFRSWCFDQGERNVPTQKLWLKEIEGYTKRPVSKGKTWRPGGYARVWAVVPVRANAPIQNVHKEHGRTSVSFTELVGQ